MNTQACTSCLNGVKIKIINKIEKKKLEIFSWHANLS